MRKIISKIAGLMLGLSLAAGVGLSVSSSKQANESKAVDYNTPTSYSLASNVPTGLTASVSLTKDSSGRGMGKGGVDYTLTTASSFTGVGKVVVNAATNYGSYSSHSISVTVGGNAFSTSKSFTAKASTDYTFEDSSATGAVVVSFNNAADGTTKSNTIWCLTVSIYTVATASYTVNYYPGTGASGTIPSSTGSSITLKSWSDISSAVTSPSGKAFAGWNTQSDGSGTGYSAGQVVAADLNLYAQWADAYSVTYSAGTNGTGSYVHELQPAGTYSLLPFASLSGVSASSGYRFKDYTVGGVIKNPGDTISIASATSVTVNFEEKPAESTYDFTANFSTYAGSWSGYGTHEGLNGVTDIGGDYASTIDLYYVSKQSGTITDRPVFASKTASGSWAKVLQFTLDESGYKIDSIVITFAQWSSKTPDVALFKGNSASGTALDTATIGTKNTLSASDFNGTVFTIGYCDKNGSSNVQSGLTSIYITLVPLASFGTLDHITITSLPNVVYHVGETFDFTGLAVMAYDGANEGTANFKDVTSSVVTDLDNPSAFVDGDVPGFDCDVSYSGDGGSDTKSFHVYVYALAEYELVESELEDWSIFNCWN